MTLWLIRAGRHGEHEQKFLEEDRVFLTWHLQQDLSEVQDRDSMKAVLRDRQPAASDGKITNHAAQNWAFVHGIQPGDWFVLPSKMSSTIHVGEITGPYAYDAEAPEPYWHSRSCRWLAKDVQRSRFDQDLLYSFGAFLTVCRIKRNDAEQRVRAMAAHDWRSTPGATVLNAENDVPSDDDAEHVGLGV